MIYTILIYGAEDRAAQWTPAEEGEVMNRHAQLRHDLAREGKLGPVLRLMPNDARTVRKRQDRWSVTDGPYAETKEQLMGLYVIDCASFEDAIAAVERLDFDGGVFEIRATPWLDPGVVAAIHGGIRPEPTA